MFIVEKPMFRIGIEVLSSILLYLNIKKEPVAQLVRAYA